MNESLITVKTPIDESVKNPFTLDPKTEDEKKYLTSLKDLLKNKRYGDWGQVSEETGISIDSVKQAFFRVFGKHHFVVVEKLKEIIETRNNLIKIDE